MVEYRGELIELDTIDGKKFKLMAGYTFFTVEPVTTNDRTFILVCPRFFDAFVITPSNEAKMFLCRLRGTPEPLIKIGNGIYNINDQIWKKIPNPLPQHEIILNILKRRHKNECSND